jgi:uncharacterized phage infection (PIP) family protein YhgE
MGNGIKTLNTFNSPKLAFDAMDRADFSDTNLMFNGPSVSDAKDMAKRTADDFAAKIEELASKIVTISQAGVSSTNIDTAISDFKTNISGCAEALKQYGAYFETVVNDKLDTVARQESRARDTAQSATAFDKSMDSLLQGTQNIKNYASQVKQGVDGFFTGVGQVVNNSAGAVKNAAVQDAKDAGNAIRNAYNNSMDWIYDNVTEPGIDEARRVAGGIGNVVSGWGQAYAQGYQDADTVGGNK